MPPHTPQSLSALAKTAYTRGPLLLRRLQHYRPFISPFDRLLPHVPHGATILDVGCGGGLFLMLLAQNRHITLGVGFDSAAPAIQTARAAASGLGQLGSLLRFEHLDATAPWPAEPALFDVVSIIDVIHHVPPPFQKSVILTAAARVRPGGILLYKDMCRRPRWRAAMNRLHDLVMARQWIHYAPIAAVEAWSHEAGLTLIHSEDTNRWWYGHELRIFSKAPLPQPAKDRR